MNPSISVLFRAIPLAMGAVCLAFGLYVLSGGDDADHFVAGHVNVALTAICIALFTTAATIIRQLVHRYGKEWAVALPVLGYTVALATMIWGITIIARGDEPQFVVAGHVVLRIGFITACVSTVATASTKFVLIQKSAARPAGGGAPDGAYSKGVGIVLIAIPALFAMAGLVLAVTLYAKAGDAALVAGNVMVGLSLICSALVALVASIVRQVRNEFGDAERYRWAWWVVAMGTINVALGLVVLFSSDNSARLAPGTVLIGLGLVCFSILSKALLLALVWRKVFALANRIPIIRWARRLPACSSRPSSSRRPSRNRGSWSGRTSWWASVRSALFSIVSILEAGTSK